MSTKYQVKITSIASNDLYEIYSYIAETLFAETSAKNLMREIDNAITSLNEMPYRYSLSLDKTLRGKGYRRVVIKSYVILFQVNEKDKIVTVVRVFHSSMNYTKYI